VEASCAIRDRKLRSAAESSARLGESGILVNQEYTRLPGKYRKKYNTNLLLSVPRAKTSVESNGLTRENYRLRNRCLFVTAIGDLDFDVFRFSDKLDFPRIIDAVRKSGEANGQSNHIFGLAEVGVDVDVG
jgi:hypothetical protein